MRPRQAGFSLVEALVSLLVLSIGWLGLGQLQARLSLAALEQSNTAYAQFIQSNYYEKTVSYDISRTRSSPPFSEYQSTPTQIYDIQISRSGGISRRDTIIRISWGETGDTHTKVIALTLSSHPISFDTRWLLTTY